MEGLEGYLVRASLYGGDWVLSEALRTHSLCRLYVSSTDHSAMTDRCQQEAVSVCIRPPPAVVKNSQFRRVVDSSR